MSTKTIKVDVLARVEGEGRLFLRVKDGRVAAARLEIFESPRFFEAFLRGRRFTEAPDITARICGICPVAYQMSSVQAMEAALGVEVDEPLRQLRRLLFLGEWLESHGLHIFFLHAPDFLGYQDGLALARDYPEQVKLGLRLKKAGNSLVALLGGREIHPVNVRVGGFYRTPRRSELAALEDELAWAREASVAAVRFVAGFDFPDFEEDYDFVSLRHPHEYPILQGQLASSGGLTAPVADFDKHFQEVHLPHSHALHCRKTDGGLYFVGPLARYSLNYDRLAPLAREAAQAAGLGPVCRNPFRSIVVRAVEMVQAADEALAIIRDYRRPERPAVPVTPGPGEGHGITEAPRGILYHRYRLDQAGLITEAHIVPPTSQNQGSIEADLAGFAQGHLELPEADLTWRLEQMIRNYDPCISCATHFLKLTVERE
ncbi:MAG: Ni/Fe hydrogenase subunit alpha [Deltaproteobacteria bacterium]|nr:Ni/Fe hydrogenase subunit alpha [Deltaproteobacteria bacterium]